MRNIVSPLDGLLSPFGRRDGVFYVLQSTSGTSFVDPQGRLMVATKDTV